MGAEALVLITPAYARENARLHEVDPMFGAEGYLWAYLIAGIAMLEDCRSVLDYGCGKGTLAKELAGTKLHVDEYDPGIPGKDGWPLSCDLVVALDVLEHIEPDCLDAVFKDLRTLSRKALFVVISTKLSKRKMADGRDTHLSLHDDAWWLQAFVARKWKIKRTWNTGLRLWVALLVPPC
jgi:hypothetical protein